MTSVDATGAPPGGDRASPRLLSDAVIATRLTGTPCVALLDVDGTLAPIAPRPEDARVPEETRRAVTRLARQPGVVVALLSGRAAPDARQMVDVDGIWTVGNHGAETITPDGAVTVHPAVAAAAPSFAAARAELEAALAGIPGARVEDKRWSLSVHVRLTPAELIPRVAAAVDAAARQHGLQIAHGKAVFELRAPVRVDKGTAAVALVERFGGHAPTASVLFVGDDITDEDGFRALRDRFPEAVTVRVSESDRSVPTSAEFVVDGTDGVRSLVTRLSEIRRG